MAKMKQHPRNLQISLLYAATRASLVTQYGAGALRHSHIGPNPLAFVHTGFMTHAHVRVKL